MGKKGQKKNEYGYTSLADPHSPNFIQDTRNREWVNKASCKGMDTKMFYPDFNRDVDEEVAEICENCEVRLECLEYGFAEPAALGGCWGGINGWRLRKGRKIWLDSELDVAEILEIITEAEERHGAGQRGPTPQWKVRLRNLGGE